MNLMLSELEFYNPNLHKIARSDRIGFRTKNSIV